MWATARLSELLLWPIRRGGAGGAVSGTADKDSRLEVKNQLNRDMLRTEDYFQKDTMWGQKTDAVGLVAASERKTTTTNKTLDLDISILNRSKYTFLIWLLMYSKPTTAQVSHITCIGSLGGKRQQQAGSSCFWPPPRRCVTATGISTPGTPQKCQAEATEIQVRCQ